MEETGMTTTEDAHNVMQHNELTDIAKRAVETVRAKNWEYYQTHPTAERWITREDYQDAVRKIQRILELIAE
jgi:hypothetical protein